MIETQNIMRRAAAHNIKNQIAYKSYKLYAGFKIKEIKYPKQDPAPK